MPWEQISRERISEWNEHLKQTNAGFYQYPFFIITEYNSFFSKSVFIKFIEKDQILAYAAILEIGLLNFKIGIIEDGPVFFKNYESNEKILGELKNFAIKRGYIHLQIRPNNKQFEFILENDKNFQQKVFFPFHQKEDYNWNINNKPEDDLLAGFKIQCRRKIVLAGRINFRFVKLEDKNELEKINSIFSEAARDKNYKKRPFRVFKQMYLEGKKYGLCDIFVAYLDKEIVNAIFIIKDKTSYYHLSSAVVLKGYHVNESPPAKLHLFLMRECFYKEHKEFYNISYGGSENLVRFKELFNPVEVKRAPYYTFIIQPKKLNLFKKLNPQYLPGLRNILKKAGDLFY